MWNLLLYLRTDAVLEWKWYNEDDTESTNYILICMYCALCMIITLYNQLDV